jgi:hypothetical protein
MTTYGTTPHGATGTQSNGLAIAGLVCGIVGLFLFNIVLGPLAIIFGSIGLSRSRRGAGHGTMSGWSIALGIVDIAVFVALLAVATSHGSYFHVG